MSNYYICTTALCAQGRTRVQEMRRVFNVLSGNASFNRAKFEPSVLSIEQTFDDAYSMFSEWIPFNPTCCAVDDIGKQAVYLTARMQQAAGVEITPPPEGNGIDLDALITLGALAVGVMFLGNLQAVTRRS